jgi:hypothetical protein
VTQPESVQRIEIVRDGKRLTVPLSAVFVDRLDEIVGNLYTGYLDLADFVRAALRSETDRAEKGIYSRARRESRR